MTLSEDILCQEPYGSEGLLLGLFYNDPKLFTQYPDDKINTKHFGNRNWAFWFGIGRYITSKGAEILDDITVFQAVKELSAEKAYERYGGFDQFSEIVYETKNKSQNFQMYYDEIKKYNLLRNLRELFGEQVIQTQGKYDYHKMSANQLKIYWTDKLNEKLIDIDKPIIEYDLLADLDDFLKQIDENSDVGMPFHNSKRLNEVTNGNSFGTITIVTGFSGAGKSSFSFEKLVMACIEHKEKLVILGNEMGVKAYRKMLLITVMGERLYEKYVDNVKDKAFNRKHINKGKFTEEEWEKLSEAIKWVENKIQGNNSLIKFIPLNDYTRSNLEKIIRHYAHRGYRRVFLDTAKPTEDESKERWRTFVEDFDMLYSLTKPESLNLATYCTAQAADEYVKHRFLNELCIGDGKKVKNVGDLTMHLRAAWDSEYEGGKNEVEVYNFVPDDFGEGYCTKSFTLDRDKIYYFLFISKNRNGETNSTGLDVLVYQVNFNTNRWIEVGWTKSIPRDFGF